MKRKLLTGLWVGLLVVGSVLWIVTFPFREAVVLRAVPADATYVSVHERLGQRLPAILESGMADPILRAVGLDPAIWVPEMLEDEGLRWMRKRLLHRYVAVGYVEQFGVNRRPAWVASTWMGGLYTQMVRIGWLDKALGDFQMEQFGDSGRIWTQFYPELPPGFQHVSFGIYEGVAFGCASDHPLAARQLARRMRRQQNNGLDALLEAEAAGMQSPEVPDRAMLRHPDQAGILQVSLDWAKAGTLEVGLVGDAAWIEPLSTDVLGQAIPSEVAMLLDGTGARPAVLLATQTAHLVGALRALPVDRMLRDTAVLLQAHAARADGAVVAWLAGGAQGGRLMRIRIPAVGLAFHVREPGKDTLAVLTPVLQRLEAAHQVAWQAEPYGQHGVYALQPPPEWLYSRFPAKERAGFVVRDGWAILHSHAESLDRFMGQQREPSQADSPPWAGSAGWYARLDGPAMADVVRTALAGYGLWQMAQGAQRDRDQEAWVKRVAQVLEEYAMAQVLVHGEDEAQSERWGALVAIRVRQQEVPPVLPREGDAQ